MNEENVSKEMMARFRREKGARPSVESLSNILRIAKNVKQAADIARPLPKEVIDSAGLGLDHIAKAMQIHENKGSLSEISHVLKRGVDAITGAGHAIFNLGKDVHNKLESASESYPGIYSDVMDTTLGVPHEHLDRFIEEANKGN